MKAALLCVMVCLLVPALAQQELTLHFADGLTQSSSTNPAFFPTEKWTISLPAVGFNYGNNAFSYHDLFKRTPGDSLLLNVNGVLGKLNTENVIQYQMNVDLLRIGFKYRRFYLSLLTSEKVNVKFYYKKDLIDFFWNGNVNHIGDTLTLTPRLNATYYREVSLGGGYAWDKIKIGGRAKFLMGIADMDTPNGNLQLYTGTGFYTTSLSADYTINTAGINNFQRNPLSASLSTKNLGVGFDLGISATPSKHLTLNASLINVGTIYWHNDVHNYHTSGTFNFEGVPLSQYFKVDTVQFKSLGDTLRTTFLPDSTEKPYRSRLIPKVYLSGKWKWDKNEVGAMLYTEYFDGFRPAVSLFAARQVLPILKIGTTISVKNAKLNNLGMLAILSKGIGQLYFTSDNIVGLIKWKDAKSINARVGVNLLFK